MNQNSARPYSLIWLRLLTYALFGAVFTPLISSASSLYVSDELEITLRTGPSTSNKITKMLRSGDALEILTPDNQGYSQVIDTSGAKGWVLTRFLMDQPSARNRLETLKQRELELQKFQEEANAAQIAATQTQAELAESKKQIVTLKTELADLKNIASSSVKLNNENIKLTKMLKTAQESELSISNENTQLRNNVEQQWFIRGAGVVLIGMLLGLLLPKLSGKKKRTWGTFEI